MKKLLFVCSGNTCRSPLAEGIARHLFPDRFLKEIEISSAGTSAVEGLPASEMAVEVARMHGIDLTMHRSRSLDISRIAEADMIIALTRRHREIIGTVEPAALGYTYVLSDFCGGVPGDITDPIGSGLDVYQKTFAAIHECIEALTARIERFDGWKHEQDERK